MPKLHTEHPENQASLTPLPAVPGKQQVARRCIECNTPFYFNLDIKQFQSWRNGELIQNAFPTLSAGDRELLISSMCEFCFDSAFQE